MSNFCLKEERALKNSHLVFDCSTIRNFQSFIFLGPNDNLALHTWKLSLAISTLYCYIQDRFIYLHMGQMCNVTICVKCFAHTWSTMSLPNHTSPTTFKLSSANRLGTFFIRSRKPPIWAGNQSFLKLVIMVASTLCLLHQKYNITQEPLP